MIENLINLKDFIIKELQTGEFHGNHVENYNYDYVHPKLIHICKVLNIHLLITDKAQTSFYTYANDRITLDTKHENKTLSPGLTLELAHEIIHATGAPKRLNRTGFWRFLFRTRRDCAIEECIAEIGAVLLCYAIHHPFCRVENLVYLYTWNQLLKKNDLEYAGGQAIQAVMYILNTEGVTDE